MTMGDDTYTAAFRVSEYQKPHFEIGVLPAKPDFKTGEAVERQAAAELPGRQAGGQRARQPDGARAEAHDGRGRPRLRRPVPAEADAGRAGHRRQGRGDVLAARGRPAQPLRDHGAGHRRRGLSRARVARAARRAWQHQLSPVAGSPVLARRRERQLSHRREPAQHGHRRRRHVGRPGADAAARARDLGVAAPGEPRHGLGQARRGRQLRHRLSAARLLHAAPARRPRPHRGRGQPLGQRRRPEGAGRHDRDRVRPRAVPRRRDRRRAGELLRAGRPCAADAGARPRRRHRPAGQRRGVGRERAHLGHAMEAARAGRATT